MDLVDIFIYVIYLVIFVIFVVTVFSIGKRYGPTIRGKFFNKMTLDERAHQEQLKDIRLRARRESEIKYEEEMLKLKVEGARTKAENDLDIKKEKTKVGKNNIGADISNINKSLNSFWSTDTKVNINTKDKTSVFSVDASSIKGLNSNNMFKFESVKPNNKNSNNLLLKFNKLKKQ